MPVLHKCPLQQECVIGCMYYTSHKCLRDTPEQEKAIQLRGFECGLDSEASTAAADEAEENIKRTLILDKYLEWLAVEIKEYQLDDKTEALVQQVLTSKSRIALPLLAPKPYVVVESLRAVNWKKFKSKFDLDYRLEDIVDIEFSMAQRIRLAKP